MSALLNVNSAALTLQSPGAEVVEDIGAAYADGSDVRFGESALQQCRLNPRLSHVSYLEQLTADPLGAGSGSAQSQADLVYLQLKSLGARASLDSATAVLAAVPGHLSADQLGLLLGIASEAGITLGGFVDRAVLDASSRALPARLAHLDVHLGGACLSLLAVDEEVARTEARWFPELGLLPSVDRCVTAIAARFVDSTRFDPLKIAATEQQLFDQIIAMFDGRHHAEFAIDVSHDGASRRLDASEDLIEAALADRYQRLATDLADVSDVLITTEALRLPGLAQALSAAGKNMITAEKGHRWQVANAQQERLLSADGVLYATTLPAERADESALESATVRASHVLSADTAYPIGQIVDGVHYLADSDGSVRAVATSAESLQRGTDSSREFPGLKPGDRVSVNGREHRLIRVEG